MSGRGKGSVSWHRWQMVWMLRKLGRGQRDIARELGVSLSTVQHYLRKGRPPRPVGYLTPGETASEFSYLEPGEVAAFDLLSVRPKPLDPRVTQRKPVSSGSREPRNVVMFGRRGRAAGGAT